jgi:RNA polymerase sigma-70 factor (ECF subfamily)
MPEKHVFDSLIARLRAGDERAAEEVFRRYTRRLVALARIQLRDGVRRKVDPEDVVQSAYRSFFRRQRAGQFKLDNWDNLWGILAVITLRKCGNRVRYFHQARRDVHREVPLRASQEARAAWEAIARDPSPSEAVVLAETVQRMMSNLEPHERDIVSMHLQGYAIAEISNEVRYAERTVRRTLERIRKRLRRMQLELDK